MLDDLSIHIFPVAYLENRHLVVSVIYKIDNSVTPLSHSVTIGVPSELFGSRWPWVRREGLNSPNDAATIGLCADCLKLLRGRRFDQQPIFGHAVSSPE